MAVKCVVVIDADEKKYIQFIPLPD